METFKYRELLVPGRSCTDPACPASRGTCCWLCHLKSAGNITLFLLSCWV